MREKIQSVPKKYWLELGIVAVVFLINLFALLHHEIWRDEAQAWLIAKNTSFTELFGELKIEGHPILWFLILRPFAKLGFPVGVIGVISLVIMTFASWILVHYAPFPLWLRAVIVFSDIFLYFMPVISRVYAVIVLLVFLLAVLYRQKLEKPLAYTVLIALLLQTHVIMGGFAVMLWLFYCVEVMSQGKKKWTKKQWMAALIPPASLILLVLELIGNGRTSSVQVFEAFTDNLFSSVRMLFDNLVFTVGQAIGYEIPALLFWVILLPLLLLLCVKWKIYWKELIVCIGGIGAQILINVFIYGTITMRAIMTLVILVFFLWIVYERAEAQSLQTDDLTGHGAKKTGAHRMIRIYFSAGITVLCLFSMTTSVKKISRDYKEAYSDSRELAVYMNAVLPEGSIIVSNHSSMVTAVCAYAPDFIYWDPSSGKQYTFVNYWYEDFDICRGYEDIRQRIIREYGSTEGVYLLIDNLWIPSDLDLTELIQLHPSLVLPMTEDECFSLYAFK